MASSLPWTSSALVLGGIAIVGLPPFGLFVSEFMILTQAFTGAHYFIAILLLAVLSVVFGSLLHHFQRMLGGEGTKPRTGIASSDLVAMAACAGCLLVLGIRIPQAFNALLHAALAVLQ
jgi:hydrogenase-4 component F